MKTLIVAMTALCLLSLTVGCARFRTPAAVPSDQRTPLVLNADTRDVLMNASDKDIQVLASALESQTESGSVIYVDHQGWVYNPDGTLFLDKDNRPIKVRTRVIAKLNSMKELAQMEGVDSVEYDVGGFEYGKDLPAQLQGKDLVPAALRLRIKGIAKMAAVDTTPAMREAAGNERAKILDGMAKLATARGAAFAVRVDALGKGMAAISTAAGKIVGTVLKTAILPVDGDLLAAGVSKAVSAVVRTADGKLVDIVAADTAGQADASTCQGCEQAPAN